MLAVQPSGGTADKLNGGQPAHVAEVAQVREAARVEPIRLHPHRPPLRTCVRLAVCLVRGELVDCPQR